MAQISTDSFLDFCESMQGQVISTRAGRAKFTVCLADDGDGVKFTPLATNKPRFHKRKFIERILSHFEKTNGSFITSDYQHLTVNASYQLTLIDRYLKSHAA